MSLVDTVIRDARSDDASRIVEIYNHYVRTTTSTFDEEPTVVASIVARIAGSKRRHPWLVIEHEGLVQGYAYATEWKGRSAYRFSVETSIYLDPVATGRGLGRHVYQALLDRLDQVGVHCAIAGITLPNDASIGLHEALGFRRIGVFRSVGFKFDRWLDVGYWQRSAG